MLLARDGGRPEIESPPWMQVEESIRELDNHRHTEVGLYVDDNCYLQIGGGSGTYICSVRINDELYTLQNKNGSSKKTKWVVAGQGFDVPTSECVDVTTALEVAHWFWQYHSIDTRQEWKAA